MDDFQSQINAALDRYARIRAEEPDLSGIDWAWEHGWITQEEYDEAHRKAHEIEKQYRELDKLFTALAASHAESFSTFIEQRRRSMEILSRKLRQRVGHRERSAMDQALASDAEKALHTPAQKRTRNWHTVAWALWAADGLLRRHADLL